MLTEDTQADHQPSPELPGVLAVDDEAGVLSALSRLLHRDGVRLLTATSGAEALQLLENKAASIGVLISDYSMPDMNGAELLHTVRLRWPDITRVLLTGNADLLAAARAVNEGHLSRLYTKPWNADEIRRAVGEALDQHRILTDNRRLRALADQQAAHLELWNQRLEGMVAERTAELEDANARLQRGLLETVRLLLTSLEQRLPQRAAHCKEVARLAGRLAERAGMGPDEARRVQVAALVHDVGLTALPDALLRRGPAELTLSARTQYQHHAALGQRMLSTVDQLTDVASWIRHHHERWDGSGYPDRLAGLAIPLPARIIALADGYVEAVAIDTGTASRWLRAQQTDGAFDPDLIAVLGAELSPIEPPGTADGGANEAGADHTTRPASSHDDEARTAGVPVEALRAGMVLVEDVLMTSGAVLLRAGEPLTAARLQRIQQFQRQGALLTTVVEVAVGAPAPNSAVAKPHAP